MKKLFTLTLAATLFASYAFSAKAELELSGNVTSIVGYQHNDEFGGSAHQGGAITDTTVTNSAPVADQDIYGVWLDSIELDGSAELGENVGIRFDLDFADHTNNNGSYLTGVEQGYVTFNVPLGNGWAWSVGKFNSGVGLESVDRASNTFVAYTPSWVYLTPKNLLGISGYYEFNDNWNLTFSVVNDFNGYDMTSQTSSAYPSALLDLGWAGGDEGENTINLALGAGLEHSTTAGENSTGATGINENEGLELFGNIYGQWVFNYFTVGYEGVVRGTSSVNDTFSSDMSLSYGGQLFGKYAFSDVNSVQARYALHLENAVEGDGASTTGGHWNGVYGVGFEGLTHQAVLGFTHMITDGANVTAEYVFTMSDSDDDSESAIYHNFLVGFGYSF